jgi:glyoxylate reductase
VAKPKAYVNINYPEEIIQPLTEVCEVRAWREARACPREVLEPELAEIEAFVGHTRWTGELMDKAPKLRIIANIGVGYDNVDVAAATQRGIVVTNTPEVLTDTTADLAFSLILASARRICEANRFVRDGQWKMLGGAAAFIGSDVHHATLGIVGMGRIGAAVAHRGLGFHMSVIYYDVVRREDLEQQFGYKFVDFDTLLAQSDFISMHMPLMEQTRHMMGQEQFAKMKPSAFFINAARGPVVDEQALYKALREGQIAGAGLDVFEVEPTPTDNPLLQLDNVVALPHIGSATGSCRQRMMELTIANAASMVSGKGPLTPVNPEVLKK